ncbi:hypothetical protein [Chamaesiphon polymorphus]|uniref:hypothetical protein n=1 Tax=Chamaesiphon polymorphus TaxID=2107691 RepID=UPI001C63B611|nr:hypothetical protein [Chamaesiphon polymorphus]
MVMALAKRTIQLLLVSIELVDFLAFCDRYFRSRRWESTIVRNIDRIRSIESLITTLNLSEWREVKPQSKRNQFTA